MKSFPESFEVLRNLEVVFLGIELRPDLNGIVKYLRNLVLECYKIEGFWRDVGGILVKCILGKVGYGASFDTEHGTRSFGHLGNLRIHG